MRRSDKNHWLLLFLLLLWIGNSADAQNPKVSCPDVGCYPQPFDVFDNFPSYPSRSLAVNSTCVDGTIYKSLLTSANYTCNATELKTVNLYDNDVDVTATYWQSELMFDAPGAAPKPQFITVNLTDEFILHTISVEFMPPPTKTSYNDEINVVPAFVILKMDSSKQEWTALHYIAQDCKQAFPAIPLLPTNPTNFNIAYCENATNELANFVVYSPFFNFQNFIRNNKDAIRRFSITALLINFTAPANFSDKLKSYLAIDYLSIDVQCLCNGHAQNCIGQNGATCNCTHNTTGPHCETCLPLYNNKPWQIGNTTKPNACEACSCNGYASSCVYDANKMRGVCNCTGNTAGDGCETCLPGYYINSNFSTQGGPYCLACNCNAQGAEDTASCNVTTGQCNCKKFVNKKDCSECQDGFWSLGSEPSVGCHACNCNTSGTVNNTIVCDKTTGQCPCKVNVEGITCNQCKNLTYNSNASNQLECSSCDCDPGASKQLDCSQETFHLCTCYGDIGGRDCRVPSAGQYVPRLDVIILEPEAFTSENVVVRPGHGTPTATVSGRGFVNITSSSLINITFNATYSGVVEIVIRYEKNSSDLSFNGSLISMDSYNCNNSNIMADYSWPISYSGNKPDTRGGVLVGKACLNTGTRFKLTIRQLLSTPILVDSVVFLPDLSVVPPQLSDRIPSDNISSCYQMAVNNVRSIRLSCSSLEYSIMAFLLQKTLACSCLSGALNGNICDPHSGDCHCLPGVLAPDCSQCSADHYQLSSTTGCLACACNKNGSVAELCDSQGNCSCHLNVQGMKCDACLPGYYGLQTGNGCTQCRCNSTYSLDSNCDDLGNCHCKPGIKGPLCDGCMEGYFNLSTNGCTSCGCNSEGSSNETCDVITGSCRCLPRVNGTTCSQCKTGYYGLGRWHAEGCISCFCWGHGTQCTSAPDWYSTSIVSNWTSSWPADVWTSKDNDGNPVNITTANLSTQFAMRIELPQQPTKDIFFTAPQTFLGNRQSSYGRYLNVTMSPASNLSNAVVEVELAGVYSNYCLVYQFNELHYIPAPIGFTLKIPILEKEWRVTDKLGSSVNISALGYATHFQMMETISSLKALWIRAYLANASGILLDLLSVVLDSATSENQSGNLINNIEMCSCLTGYMGSSCELCALGYTKSNGSSPASACVPCSCNGHGATACDQPANSTACLAEKLPCDPVTGVCTCQNHTKGDHCEFCSQGYYGDPLKGTADDCKPCACPGLIVAQEVNVFASSCSLIDGLPVCNNCTVGHSGNKCQNCMEGYFGTPENVTNAGGKCQPCVCNGRADTCDSRTGKCFNCKNNTAGQNCELCALGYYGNPLKAECQACLCANLLGSTGSCNQTTGACECLPNVIGTSCDQCENTTFNLTAGIGCEPCNCHLNGSTDLVCDKSTGQCVCRPLVTGRTCSQCQNGYWNVNTQTGCDECSCNTNGTAKYINGTSQETCQIQTGQCNCALPGILGRTCNTCSPVSQKSFTYVSSFYLGNFPNCAMCGECYDSWGSKINDIGLHLASMNSTVNIIWNDYNNQTFEEINAALTNIEIDTNKAFQLVDRFEQVSQELAAFRTHFTKIQADLDDIALEIHTLKFMETNLEGTLHALNTTDAVDINSTVTTSLGTLKLQLDNLIQLAQSTQSEGDASYSHIQSLTFVVSTPEVRQQKLVNQAQQFMDFAAAINKSYSELKTLYDTSLSPGSSFRVNKLNDTDGKLQNVTKMINDSTALILNVTQSVNSASSLLSAVLADSNNTSSELLNIITMLEQLIFNASRAQNAAYKILTEAQDFKLQAQNTEQVIIGSMTTILERIISLNQIYEDLTLYENLSQTIQSAQLPSVELLQTFVRQIEGSTVSVSAVADANLKAQQALYDAGVAVQITQKALSQARQLSEGLHLMSSDITTAQSLRLEAETVLEQNNALNGNITNVLIQASNHSSQVQANITQVMQLVQQLTDEIKNVSDCLTQKSLNIKDAITSSSQLKDQADTLTQDQLKLTDALYKINVNKNDPNLTPASANLTQANNTITNVTNDLEQLATLAQLEVLLPELLSQQKEIQDLNSEIDKMTSDIDSITQALDTVAGSTTCTA